jgi:hypothetical protein
MRLTNRLALTPPGLTRLWDGLVRTGLLLARHRGTYAFSDVVREFDEPLFWFRRWIDHDHYARLASPLRRTRWAPRAASAGTNYRRLAGRAE